MYKFAEIVYKIIGEMNKKKLTAGLSFGLFMTVFNFVIYYFLNDEVPAKPVSHLLLRAVVTGIISGVIFGLLVDRFPKKKYP